MGNSASQTPAVRLNLSLKDCLVFNCCVKSPKIPHDDDDDEVDGAEINTVKELLEEHSDSSVGNVC